MIFTGKLIAVFLKKLNGITGKQIKSFVNTTITFDVSTLQKRGYILKDKTSNGE